MIEVVDIRGRLDCDDVREVIHTSYSIEHPVSEREGETNRILAGYRRRTEERLLAAQSNGELVGFIGLRWRLPFEATIRQIGVLPGFRNKGVARRLVLFVIENFNLRSLEAETHQGAVKFYEKTGFTVVSLGEKYPGTERFFCRWQMAE